MLSSVYREASAVRGGCVTADVAGSSMPFGFRIVTAQHDRQANNWLPRVPLNDTKKRRLQPVIWARLTTLGKRHEYHGATASAGSVATGSSAFSPGFPPMRSPLAAAGNGATGTGSGPFTA